MPSDHQGPPRPLYPADRPPPSSSGRKVAALVALILTLAGIGIAVTVADDDDDGRPDRVTIDLRGARELPGSSVPERMVLGDEAIEARDDVAETRADGHAGARDEEPPNARPAELEAARRQQQAAAGDPFPAPLAAPFQRGCRTRLVGNFSSRNGIRPRLFVLHYTVSRNRPGFADVDGITAYFNSGGAQASSNYVVDADGNCNLIVGESSKAWAQATYNPFAISVEVIAYGDEKDYANPAGYAKLALLYRDAARRWGIPLQRGQVSGGRVVRAGILDHHALGALGGGHHDVSPFEPRNRAVTRVLELARAGDVPPAPHNVSVWCAGVERYRAQVRAHKNPGAGARRLATARRELAAKHGYRCGVRSGRSVAVKR